MAFEGGCLCGSIRYAIDRKYLNALHCYCSMCRKAHGTAFSTHVGARRDQVRWLTGESLLTVYESSPGASRQFCVRCGTHLLVLGQAGPDIAGIPAGTLDGDPPIHITGHMYAEDRVSWYHIADDLPQYPQWPPGVGPKAPDIG
jgi:hypothetical protein